MANEAEFNREQKGQTVDAFSLMEPVGKIAAWPKRLQSFFHDVRVEMRHVNWPSRADVISTTIVVTVTVAFFGVYFFLTDSAFSSQSGVGWPDVDR